MKKILYITNVPTPYKTRLFSELAKRVNLTVVYERNLSNDRDTNWSTSVKGDGYKNYVLMGNKCRMLFDLLSIKFRQFDEIIISNLNSTIQCACMFYLRLRRIPFSLNIDGNYFLEKTNLKMVLKKILINLSTKIIVAGEINACELSKYFPSKKIQPLYFSSFSGKELDLSEISQERENFVLVVGSYFDYKGMDIALNVARLDRNIHYKFIGMGKRCESFQKKFHTENDTNVEFIPFLQKEELNAEYQRCSVFMLPSRQECWGLVINEAAMFGSPIVSTWGSGAAVEFLKEKYSEYLVEPGNSRALYVALKKCMCSNNAEYCSFLKKKSKKYTIEEMVENHLALFDL